jgi:mono/diheme cytochrome c family protein
MPEAHPTDAARHPREGRLGLIVRTWLAAWIVAGALAGAAALAVVEFGLFDATATTPHSPMVAWATHTAFVNSVSLRAGRRAPAGFTADQVIAGAGLYDQHCAMCHGGPGTPRAAWVAGMNPTPPYIIDAGRRFSPAQLHWIISRGVKMTGMPAWRGVETPAQTWDVVAFLEALPYLDQGAYRRVVTKAAGHP